MRYIGIDLHKRSMTIVVIDRRTGETVTKRFQTCEVSRIRAFFQAQVPFCAVVEASATYEWLWELLEPIAERLVLAHPAKVRVIAESTNKNDKVDAGFLAWLLSMDAVPEAHKPSPRQREYQNLCRLRVYLVRQAAKVQVKIRHIFANRNIDFRGSVTPSLARTLAADLKGTENFCVFELAQELDYLRGRIKHVEKALRELRAQGTEAEKKVREIIESVPGVGKNVCDVILSTVGDASRFSSMKKLSAYCGLAPGVRISDKTRKELPITKKGPSLLRSRLVQAAWRAIRYSEYFRRRYEILAKRRGKKKAVVAVARQLIGIIYTLLRKGEPYCPPRWVSPPSAEQPTAARVPADTSPTTTRKSGKAPAAAGRKANALGAHRRSARGRSLAAGFEGSQGHARQLPQRSAASRKARRPLGDRKD